MNESRSSTASSFTIPFRCTVSHVLLRVASLLWRTGARLLPLDHPARAFALGASDLAKPTKAATLFEPSGDRVNVLAVATWTAALTGGLALLMSDLLATATVVVVDAVPLV